MAKHRKENRRKKVILSVTRYLMIILYSMLLGAYLYSVWEFDSTFNEPVTTSSSLKKSVIQDDPKSVTNASTTDLTRLRKQAIKFGVQGLGRIRIKDLGIDLPIYAHTNKYTLAVGATVYKSNPQNMGKENYILAGHNVRRPNILFSNLSNAKKGQVIELEKGSDIYRYKIILVKVINPKPSKSDSELFNVNSKEPLVTLFTCAEHGTHREVVQGRLIK